jgi:hydroxylamine reductase
MNDNKAYTEILYILNTINYPEISAEILIKKINHAVKTDNMLFQKLQKIRTEKYGEQTEVNVSYSTRPAKAILVAGTNLQELKKVLDATEGTDIDVYTHGEMILAYTYPKFREYPQLKGQFGKGVESCLLDFATFPGAILIAKHSLENIEYLYRGRLFTTDSFVPQGVIQIKNDDYSQLINSALSAKGFKRGREKESVKTGCSDKELKTKINKLIKNIDNYKDIIILGTEINTHEQKKYYEMLTKHINKETALITLSDSLEYRGIIHINSAPDFNMIYRIWDLIKDTATACGIKVSLFLAKCDKHTISNIINIKHSGVNNVFLSRCTPVMLNPTLTETLKTLYLINPTSEASEDLKIIYND